MKTPQEQTALQNQTVNRTQALRPGAPKGIRVPSVAAWQKIALGSFIAGVLLISSFYLGAFSLPTLISVFLAVLTGATIVTLYISFIVLAFRDKSQLRPMWIAAIVVMSCLLCIAIGFLYMVTTAMQHLSF